MRLEERTTTSIRRIIPAGCFLAAILLTGIQFAVPNYVSAKSTADSGDKKTKFTWLGAWDGNNTPYVMGDAVQYDGSSYICVQDHISSNQSVPGNNAQEPYWSLMAAAGEPGTSSWTDGRDVVTTTKKVEVGSGVQYTADDSTPCKGAADAGTIRWTGQDFEGCNGMGWVSLTTESTPSVPTVTSATGQVWMDRNLGASRVAQDPYDGQSFGDLYQWGRPKDGHEQRSSTTTSTRSKGIVPGHGEFITRSTYPWTWRTCPDSSPWQGIEGGLNNPCPPGFRLPTDAEFQRELNQYGHDDPTDLYYSPLKLPLTGYRHTDGTIKSGINHNTYYLTQSAYSYSYMGENPNNGNAELRCVLQIMLLCFDIGNGNGVGSNIHLENETISSAGRPVRCIQQ